jgi:hypothetical protein
MRVQPEHRRERLRAFYFGLLIVVAALLAHGGCLRAIFYLDDWGQIRSFRSKPRPWRPASVPPEV